MEMESRSSVDPKMEEPQKHALGRDWDSFKNFFKTAGEPRDLIQSFNLGRDTAIHVAARSSDDSGLVRELLDMLPEDSCRWRALREGNAHRNTLLHQVVFCKQVNMVDAVVEYEMERKLKQDRDENLLELLNDLGETPVYRAAKYGRLSILKRMERYVDDMQKHFYRDSDFTSILHIAIIGQHFDVAVWLMTKKGIRK
ncbi:uncharacterized protein LOC129314583 [Prosopis cineraria]|uniref:uncharacterized protein LOC129314583 n=1 Tax=Prosopis cineraria TaxID=364024 RepID=UPI00240FACA4|nr:uncharacterized protein LOC129314583 [Prosopis cineraria]